MFGFSRKEEKELLTIEKRRLAEEERKKRIFDAKNRLMGIDRNAIDEQVREKQDVEHVEKERDQFFDEQLLIHTKHGEFLQRKLEAVKKQKQRELEEFRQTNQKREYAREFDLNDPDYLKKDLPPRTSDDDPRLSISGVQRFHGEDLSKEERVLAQREQMKTWIEQQLAEKAMRKNMEDTEHRMWERKMEEMNFLAHEVEKQRHLLKAEKERAIKEYNIEQTIAKRERELEEAERDELDKLEEIQNMLNSDFLNENFDTTLNAFDQNRFKPYGMKSLRPEQYQEIMDTREKQILEKQLAIEKEKLESEQMALEERINMRNKLLMERERERLQREQRQSIAATQKTQAEIAQLKKRYLEESYANDITEDFFNQFNTTSR